MELKTLIEQRNLMLQERSNLVTLTSTVKMNAETKAKLIQDSPLDNLEKAEKISNINDTYNTYYSSFLDQVTELKKGLTPIEQKITQITENKKQCVAVIIEEQETGKKLFLKRATHDEFHPNTYCLPGGGVDPGENPFVAALREVFEETNISLEKVYLEHIEELAECNIYYFKAYIPSEVISVVLDEKEHSNLIWATYNEWKDLDLILDLKEHLCMICGEEYLPELFENSVIIEADPISIISNYEVIEKAFKEGKVSRTIYNQVFSTLLMKGGFPVGTVRHYSDGTSYEKIANTGGKGDWVRVKQEETIKEDLQNNDNIVENKENLIEEHERLVEVLNSESHEDDKEEAKIQEKELEEYKSPVEENKLIEKVPTIEEDYIPKIYERPEMEYPVYSLVVGGQIRFIQRLDGASYTSWIEVKHDGKYWTPADNKSWLETRTLGYTKKEAVEDLIKTYKP